MSSANSESFTSSFPISPGEEHWLLDTSLDEVYWPCSHSRAIPSFPSQLEWKIGLPRANTRGILNSPISTPLTAAYQAPRSMGFSRQEYWSGVPLHSPICIVLEETKLIYGKRLKNKCHRYCLSKDVKEISGKLRKLYVKIELWITHVCICQD